MPRKQFRKAIALEPKIPSARAALAGLYVAEERRDLAEKVLAETKAELSNDPAGYTMMGLYYLGAGDGAKALTEFASLAKITPTTSEFFKSYAQLLIMSRQFAEAERITEEILTKAPSDAEALISKGQIAIQNGKFDDCAADFATSGEKALPQIRLGITIGVVNLAKETLTKRKRMERSSSPSGQAL